MTFADAMRNRRQDDGRTTVTVECTWCAYRWQMTTDAERPQEIATFLGARVAEHLANHHPERAAS
jgi:hypothetical protein